MTFCTTKKVFTSRYRESEGSNNIPPTIFVKSCQDLDKSVCKPIVEFNPEDLIGRTFLLSSNQKCKCHEALIKQKVIELCDHLDSTQNKNVNQLNLLFNVELGRYQAIMSYNQVLN